MEITKDSTIEEILKHPKGQEVMAKYQVPCLGCPMASMEMQDLKIEQVAKQYDLDLESILEDLNADN
ncbi:MAG: DUF1858 domain-containing protein [Patescibacteria group bacterium]